MNFSAPGGDFQSVLDEDMVPFEEDVQGFLKQILEALEFIHERKIAHLDIKVLMLTSWKLCTINTGFSLFWLETLIEDDSDIQLRFHWLWVVLFTFIGILLLLK